MIATLSRTRAALIVIDIQDRLAAAMPEAIRAQVVHHARTLIAGARQLGLPIVVTQQYPKGLGGTVSSIEEALAGATALHRFDKLAFAATGCAELAQLVPTLGRDQWIVCGMETHVCVYQTARGLRARGHEVHVTADAACSRTKANWRIGLGLCERAGAITSSTEAVLFDLLGGAGTDDFKVVSRLVK